MNKVEWLTYIKTRFPIGMSVNCKDMPQLKDVSVLRRLIKEGKLVRERWPRGGNCNRTVLRLPDAKI